MTRLHLAKAILNAKQLGVWPDCNGTLRVRKLAPKLPVFCRRELPYGYEPHPNTIIQQPRLEQ